jgi:aspartyl-tRNA(Asn)/glutamyl-tRNA(Gln) amidotransferase subunit A
VPDEDAFVVSRLKQAGVVLLGKLNMHEWAMGGTNINVFYPTPRNPWDTERITGGSSGGSGAALAARYCFGSLGSDTRGSIRIPAALCGITGLKPTYARVSLRGVVPLYWSLDHAGPMARSARDCALILQAIAGYDDADPLSADVPVPDFSASLDAGVSGLRIGVPENFFFDPDAVEAPITEAVGEAARVFEGLGARLIPVTFPDPAAYTDNGAFIAEAGAYHEHRFLEQPDGFEPVIRGRVEGALQAKSVDYARARYKQAELKREYARLFRDIDFLLTPTSAIVAPRIADVTPQAQLSLIRNTFIFNTAGAPVISLPCGFAGVLPIGLSIAGRDWEEGLVLQAAHAYQQATDWHHRAPGV